MGSSIGFEVCLGSRILTYHAGGGFKKPMVGWLLARKEPIILYEINSSM